MDIPRTLYKYVTVDRVDIFHHSMIRFTQPSALNDPFELCPLIESLLPDEMVGDILEPNFQLLEEALRSLYRSKPEAFNSRLSEDEVVEIVRINPDFQRQIYQGFGPQLRYFLKMLLPNAKSTMKDVMHKKIGILSLSEDNDNILLWSHYADSHRGFTIEFNSQHEFFDRKRGPKDELYHLRKVRYSNRTNEGKTLCDIDGDELLCSKSLQWQYEKEWRVLCRLEDASRSFKSDSDEIHLFDLPLDSITGVILGANISSINQNAIHNSLIHAGLSDIKISKATLDMDNQKIVVR